MSIKELLDREGDAAERNPDAPLKPGTRVTRGHGRTKTLQVRLTDTEYEELEREAEVAGLPISTLARQKLLDAKPGTPIAEAIADAVFERIQSYSNTGDALTGYRLVTALHYARLSPEEGEALETLIAAGLVPKPKDPDR